MLAIISDGLSQYKWKTNISTLELQNNNNVNKYDNSNQICDDSYDLTCGGSTDVYFNIMRRNVLMFAVQVAGLFLFLLDPENSFVINNYKRLAKDHMKAITQFNFQVGKLTFFSQNSSVCKEKENIDENDKTT